MASPPRSPYFRARLARDGRLAAPRGRPADRNGHGTGAGRATLAERRGEHGRIATERGGKAREEAGPADDPRPDPGPASGERLAAGAETGVRRAVQGAALLLWVPSGFVFWLPFLLRRTVAYVFAVLHAGLTGGETDRAERRWEQAVGFYQFGFRRIAHAFRSGDARPEAPGRKGREPEDGAGRIVLELAWAAVVWGAILWLAGIWPDAPEAVRGATLRVGETIAEAGRRIVGWFEGLPRL